MPKTRFGLFCLSLLWLFVGCEGMFTAILGLARIVQMVYADFPHNIGGEEA
jgi:hypothetical protein